MSNGLVKWESLVKRLSGVAERECTNKGMAVVTIEVLVDSTGEPVFWSEPRIVKIEPRIGATVFLEKVLRMISSVET